MLAVLAIPLAVACQKSANSRTAEQSIQSDASAQRHALPMHDPRAMTAIDAATGDLAGLESYGSDLALNQSLERKAAAASQTVGQAPEPALLEGSVAMSGESAESAMPTEVGNSAADRQTQASTEAEKRDLAGPRPAGKQ
jgi:hypothetical protein